MELPPNPPARLTGVPSGVRWELLLLVALVGAIYFSRLGAVPFRGEETRWARVAWEMKETGDWIVPRQQGEVFPDRPPLNSWCIALASMATGDMDRVTVRLPTALATLLTVLVLYAYCSQFLSRWGAFAAGLLYATFPQILQLGQFAESDAIFTLCVTSSLLAWHTGYMRKWPSAATWTAGYALAALAGLAKGPQGPIYFAATVVVFLAAKRDWRFLLSRAHLAGLLGFCVLLGAWQIPFTRATGLAATARIWSEGGYLVSTRVPGAFTRALFDHMASYPLEVFMYLLPWCMLLLLLANGKFRRSLVSASPPVVLPVTFLLLASATCWLVPGTRPRHLMSLYPSAACVVAAVVDRCLVAPAAEPWNVLLRRFIGGLGGVAVLVGMAGVAAGMGARFLRIGSLLPPSALTVAYGAAMFAFAAVCLWVKRPESSAWTMTRLTAGAAAIGLSYTTIGLNHWIQKTANPEPQIVWLRQSVLRGERLVSFGAVPSRFTFFYRDPIEIFPWPKAGEPLDPELRYFCFLKDQAGPRLPFAWEQMALIWCERSKEDTTHNVVIVGRRVEPREANSAARHPGTATMHGVLKE